MRGSRRDEWSSIRLKSWEAYLLTVALSGAALWLRLALNDELGGAPAYVIFTVPVALAALAGGIGTGILATSLCSLGVTYFLLRPLHSLAIGLAADAWQAFLFVTAGVVVSGAIEFLQRTRRRAESAIAQDQLTRKALATSEAIRRASEHGLQEQLRASVQEISRSNRALKILSNCNQALVHAGTETEFLDEICQIAVRDGGYNRAWIGYADDNAGKTIAPVARAGIEDGYLANMALSWDDSIPQGQGPAGQVIRSGKVVICADLLADPRFQRWDESGIQSFVLMPLRQGDETFGLLSFISDEIYQGSKEEVGLLEEIADSVAFGITSLRAQSEQRRLKAAVLTVASGVSASAGAEFFKNLAHSMVHALGAHGAFVVQMLPGEPKKVRTIAVVIGDSLVGNFEFEIAGTPCDLVLEADSVVIVDGVAAKFPHLPRLTEHRAEGYVCQRLDGSSGEILGFVFVVFQKPLKQIAFITSTLRIFAARAASELERGETDIRLREQAALMDIANEAIQVRDLDGRITYWNTAAERIYGWTAAEMLGRRSVDLLYKDPAAFQEADAALLADGVWQGEMVKLTKSGRTITVDVRWTLVRDSSGNAKSVLAINTDITERKKTEDQARRAQRMESIGTLAGGIAHDLNNVLAPILMSVDTLKAAVGTTEDLALLGTLQGSAQRGADLVKQLLAFARGVEGQRINVDPVMLVHELLAVVRETFPKSIDIRFEAPNDAWCIAGDPTQIHQVLLNLCVNARDAMEDGGSLTFRVSNVVLDADADGINADCRPGRYLLMSIADTGIGIPVENRDRVFEPFFTTKSLENGTGLGLSTSTAIVKSHRGFIRFTSDAAAGTTFCVYLPAVKSIPVSRISTMVRPSLHGSGELVLLVDDDGSIRKVAQRLLERSGYSVVTAANGREAVDLYEERQSEIAIVLTDVSMPVMDGAAAVLALRAINPDVRIIVSSGLSSDGSVAEATGCAVDHFISKPYTAQTMLQTLHDALSAPTTNENSEVCPWQPS